MPIVESKEAAQYSNTGSPAEHCGICIYYIFQGTGEKGGCQIVTGEIAYGGWCRHFLATHRAA
jgi:hypothetical protein